MFEQAEVFFIKKLCEQHSDKLIVINRGFIIFPEVRPFIDGLLCEGLYRDIDNRKRYVTVSKEERQLLLALLSDIQRSDIPVIVVDYVPRQARKLARKTVQKLLSMASSLTSQTESFQR